MLEEVDCTDLSLCSCTIIHQMIDFRFMCGSRNKSRSFQNMLQ